MTEQQAPMRPAVEAAVELVAGGGTLPAPLAEAGKLGAYLLQLTPAFSPGRHSLDELDGLMAFCHETRTGGDIGSY